MSDRIIAIGDIHGCFDSLKELVENIIRLTKSDKLILLGDYIDRGDKSKEVIDFIIQHQEKGYDIVPLMGNHEAMLLDAFENEKYVSVWIQNGGNETLKSFGITSVKNIDRKYLKFFKELRYYYFIDDFLFVHAGFNNNAVHTFTDFYSMLWRCKDSYNNSLLNGKTIVHGHNPISLAKCIDRVKSAHRVINIDTGCVYTDKAGFGKLTAYVCNERKILFV